jgi:hypothetical protein
MALVLEDATLVVRRMRSEARGAGAAHGLRSLVQALIQRGIQDLKFVAVSGLNAADVVASDAPCKVYCVYLRKPAGSTTNAFAKISDHASQAQAAGDLTIKFIGTGGGGQEHAVVFHDGLKFGTGCTIGCHTTAGGNTKSDAADAVAGFVVVGAP